MQALDFRQRDETGCETVLRPRSVYRLGLANGLSWRLVTTDETERWIAQLSEVMRLERCDPSAASLHYGADGPCLSAPSEQLVRYGILMMRDLGSETYLVTSVSPERRIPANVEHLWGSFYPFYRNLLHSGGFPLHAALIGNGERFVALPAKGRTGKSTCCRRLAPPWRAFCDEEVMVVPVAGHGYRAHPFPTWSDLIERGLRMSWKVTESYPLSAIFFLEQGEKDDVMPVGQGEAAMRCCHSVRQKCHFYEWNLEPSEKRNLQLAIFENAQKLARSLPAYRLSASLNGRFWEVMDRVMNV